MSKVRQHYEYARTGVPSQECEDSGPEPAPTDWDAGTRGGADRSPHRGEKESDRED
jgi:hypothetical protein